MVFFGTVFIIFSLSVLVLFGAQRLRRRPLPVGCTPGVNCRCAGNAQAARLSCSKDGCDRAGA